MPASITNGVKGAGATGASTTIYPGLPQGIGGSASQAATESDSQALWRTSGSLSRLNIYMSAADASGMTFRTRIGTFGGASNGNQSVTSTSTGRLKDSTHSDAVTAGQFVGTQYISVSSGGIFRQWGVLFTPSSTGVTIAKPGCGYNSVAFVNGGGAITINEPISGTLQNNTSATEGQYQLKIKNAGTWRNLNFTATANTQNGNESLKSRINGSTGNQSAVLSSSTTGNAEDSTHTDTVAMDDLINLQLVEAGTTGSVTIPSFNSEIESSAYLATYICQNGTVNGILQNGTTTLYRTWGADFSSTTETDYQTDMDTTAALTLLEAQLIQNALNSGQTAVLSSRVNTAAGNCSCTWTAGGSPATGYVRDTTHTDSVVNGDVVGHKWVTGTGSNIAYNGVSMLATMPAPPASNAVTRRFIGMGR